MIVKIALDIFAGQETKVRVSLLEAKHKNQSVFFFNTYRQMQW